MLKGMHPEGNNDGEGKGMTGTVAGLITARDLEEARGIARALLEKRLVSCCNIIPKMESLYWWKNRIEEKGEALIMIKTRKQRMEEIIGVVKGMHSYDVPAVEFLDIAGGNRDFLDWIKKESREVGK
jgi:periplasmic divalent cation tolerance protein